MLVFLTVCTKHRRPLLASEPVHAILREVWADRRFWMVGRYVVLPDHIHLFCAPSVWPQTDLRRWVGYWKNQAARRMRERLPGSDSWDSVWQRDFWDTQIRRGEGYAGKWEYVRHNPTRHGLAPNPEEWPFQGEMNILSWWDR